LIRFTQDICGNLGAAQRREWLETNGLGGFASSTIVGLNTRRYHGLLVAATQPPVGRMLLLSKLEETLLLDGRSIELSSNRYPGVVHPQGFRYLKEFRLDPFPIFTFEVEGVEIEKSVFMVHGQNSTVVQYQLRSTASTSLPEKVELEIRPLIAFRDYHATTHENSALNGRFEIRPEVLNLTPYQGLPSLYLGHDASGVESAGQWYRNFEYDLERERGLDFVEDLFNPCVLRFDLRSRQTATVIASTDPRPVTAAAEYRDIEVQRRRALLAASPAKDEFVTALTAAADQYIVSRGDQKTIIAGYHWFSDWGRDTMIALPGLTLTTGRHEVARSILRTFARHVDRGMLPNRFPDAGEQPEYNSVDASLWFFEAIRAFLAYTGDLDFVAKELYPVLTDMIAWHVRGTRYGIRVDGDGLLDSGEPGVQLTWMDAKVGDWVVTPRSGKPVEIQALWYNALCILENLAHRLGDEVARERYRSMANTACEGFNRVFWNNGLGCLHDVVNADTADSSIRPNQIFAVSLPYSMLPRDRARCVVDVVERELLTPFGLRSLARGDPHYHGRYDGDPHARDAAYRQGTVWAWLIGPFITAYLRVNERSAEARRQATEWLSNLEKHLADAGVGQVSEIFDGDAPQQPRGCIAQAWSVAALLRAVVEDIRGINAQHWSDFSS
jgi:predicted glycogen debranching enzyme